MSLPAAVTGPRFHRVCLGLALAGASLAGQTPATPPPPGAESIVVLSPFEVNIDRDSGYLAGSSLAGGRIDTALDRMPAALSIQTREFLDDIAANNFTDAAQWSPSSFTVPANPDSNESRIDFRSTNTGAGASVNYFAFGVPMDTFSTERIEFARGANSIVFGQGNLAGIATINLKQARFRNFGQVQLRFDNFNSRRATLDVNRELVPGKVAVRLAVLGQDGERWRKPNPDDRRGYFFAATARLTDTFTVRAEVEYGTQTKTWAEGIFFDNASSWTGVAYNGNGSMPPPPNQGLGGGPPPNNDYLVFDPARPERGVLNYRGFGRTQGAQNLAVIPGGRPYIPNFPALPSEDFDLQPPNNLADLNYYFATVYLEQRFGRDLFVQLSANQRRAERTRDGAAWAMRLSRDPNTFLPGGARNPDFGKLYVDAEATRIRMLDEPRDFRALASWRFATDETEHRLSGFVTQQRMPSRNTNERLVRAGNSATPSPTNSANFIQQRYYLDNSRGIPFAFEPSDFPGANLQRYRFVDDRTEATGYTAQVAAVSSYFRGKLNTIVGYRHDNTDRTAIKGTPDNGTGALSFATRDSSEAMGTTTAGAVWYPVPAIGPFFNYSESFAPVPPGEPLLNSQVQPSVPRGRSREFGFHFKLLGDRVQGSVRYYDSAQHGRLVNAPGVPNINAIWLALGQGQNVAVGPQRDTQGLTSTGYELELAGNLTRDWRALLNLAVPRSQQWDSFPETFTYRARFLSQWQAAAATNTMVAQGLQGLDAALQAGADGREQNTELQYRANVYSTYDIRTGPLRGLSVGGGANLYGRQIAGNAQNQPFAYIYSPGYTSIAVHAGYGRPWRKTRWRLQLNVSNLLDKRVLLFNSVARYTPAPGSAGVAGDYLGAFRYVDPRKVTLTTTLGF